MEATQKVKVIVLGTLGIGKSTMMNVLCGKDENFKTSDAAEGCT
jgi:putative ribosome biogenesis GTPase RsgA